MSAEEPGVEGGRARPASRPGREPAGELAGLLRSRRERLRPADVGLPPGTRRRTRGLRREEVAALAAISPTYYTFLEQGREVRPSRQVLDALARALRLDPAERAHLHDLVPDGPALRREEPPDEVLSPAVADLVARLDPAPTYVTGRTWDVLAANPAAVELWGGWDAEPGDRNMLRFMFTSPAARRLYPDWTEEAALLLARFRSAAARHPGDAAFAALTDELLAASDEVRAWWPRHDVAPLASGAKRLRRPERGVRAYRHVVLLVAEDPEQKLVTFTPA